MLKPITSDYFLKQDSFKFKPVSILVFIIASVAAWEVNVFGQMFFPSRNIVPLLIRTIITLSTDIALLVVSVRLLKQNHLSAASLGLRFTKQSVWHVLTGGAVGLATIALICVMIYLAVPFHFKNGPLDITMVLRESLSYLVGNALEELIFRGFLFILLSQLLNWRWIILILALPFGLFHLQGTGFSSAGINIVVSTTLYSFVFALAFLLSRSLLAAISAHTIMNIFLHVVTGMDGVGNSLYSPVFEKSWPQNYNLGFWVSILSATMVSLILYMFIVLRNKRERLA